jgi:hypothetical protein
VKFFKHSLRYPSRKAPFAELGITQESEAPWRRGRSVVLRRPFSTRAVAIGVWRDAGTEDDFHRAAGTRPIDWKNLEFI